MRACLVLMQNNLPQDACGSVKMFGNAVKEAK
jgi:hypothetical protein